MKPAPFRMLNPSNLDDALQMLSEKADDEGLIIAGGQSLIPMMALRVAYPAFLIDINNIDELGTCEVVGDEFVIGATVRHAHFHNKKSAPGVLGEIMCSMAQQISHFPIRQMGTFCGSIAHSDPSSEWCLLVATLNGKITLRTASSVRVLDPEDYFEAAMLTAKEPDELIVDVKLPVLSKQTRWGFYEFCRRAGDFAMGMALVVYNEDNGRITNVRIGLGGIEDFPRRITEAEEKLNGSIAGADSFLLAAEVASKSVEPMEDSSTTLRYRRDLTKTVVERALRSAAASCSHQS